MKLSTHALSSHFARSEMGVMASVIMAISSLSWLTLPMVANILLIEFLNQMKQVMINDVDSTMNAAAVTAAIP